MEKRRLEEYSMHYTMKGQEYQLPQFASDISNEEEADRIRWLATYSRSDTLFEAAKALLQVYEKRVLETAEGPLVVPALLFPMQLDHRGFLSVPKVRALRESVIAQVVEDLKKIPESVTQQQRKALLQSIQNVLDELSHDGYWWGTFETVEEVTKEFDASVRGEFRSKMRHAAK